MGHHHHHHGHGHGHGHGHAEGARAMTRAFAIGVLLNVGFIAVEITYGILASSMALIADAAHNVSDVLGLLLAWGASWLARRRPTARHTYGFRRSTILAALTNAVVLFVAVGMVAWEAIERVSTPSVVDGKTMMVVAAIGVLVNGASAWMFRHSSDDLNMRGAFLHLMADAAVSLGVVVAGAIVLWTGKTWVDPVVSLAVCAVIVMTARGLLLESLNLALDAVPPHIDPAAVGDYLKGRPHVDEVHDLHIWAMSTTEVALTAHLVVTEEVSASFLREINHELDERFGIRHATIQIEAALGCGPCGLETEGAR